MRCRCRWLEVWAVKVVYRRRDIHVTMLHRLDLDDAKLVYLHADRDEQLRQVGGEVIQGMVA